MDLVKSTQACQRYCGQNESRGDEGKAKIIKNFKILIISSIAIIHIPLVVLYTIHSTAQLFKITENKGRKLETLLETTLN